MIQTISELLGQFKLNTWKIIGLTGGLMFGARWLVQAYASKQRGQMTVPALFWYLSLTGSAMQLAYFVGYRFDSVGFLATFPPSLVAAWNLYKFYRRNPTAHPATRS